MDISLAVDMMHYATVDDSYDVTSPTHHHTHAPHPLALVSSANDSYDATSPTPQPHPSPPPRLALFLCVSPTPPSPLLLPSVSLSVTLYLSTPPFPAPYPPPSRSFPHMYNRNLAPPPPRLPPLSVSLSSPLRGTVTGDVSCRWGCS